MNNVIYINKPKGITSFDVCYKLRKVLNTKKIGHTGTLDPNASGVMLILYNESTKAMQFLVGQSKEYKTRVKLGIETDTLDIMGKISKESDYVVPKKELIEETLNSFLGYSKQIVPITSAKKINGKKLYKYQLEGKDIELPEIEICVNSIKLDELFDDGFSFTANVSSGTYIRSLVRDILKKLDLIGTVYELCRTKVGNITLDDCDNLDDAINNNYHTHNIYDLITDKYKTIECQNILDIKNGKRIKINCFDDEVAIVNDNTVLAIYKKDGNEYKCVRGLW